ncbi:MAG: type I DNA topoisomerase [Proteobacteria bacterium]|nr:type I DNA topoisomerase [Cystobacterineae bacterium]MCL2259217.1 type I DNA topoisomerase [Cystobacterineae bacterium]MCL2314613.1 type I DNA topoisomerase [Pseudomonadota bacterium]
MSLKSLVVVESPAKAKTISQFLGENHTVLASIGHIMDLPESGLGVDVAEDFALSYEVKKKEVVGKLRQALKGADELFLATDEDREGEAIAFHLVSVLKPKVPVKRMVFNEITKKAILHAKEHWREIDSLLVDAQEARRALDRLYGYEVSPVLWRKVKTGLSAGRVQSPSIRLLVEREQERMRFRMAAFWDLQALFGGPPDFSAQLTALDKQRIAQSKDFDAQGLCTAEAHVLKKEEAKALVEALEGQVFLIKEDTQKPSRSSPKPPLMTSTLQQEAGRKLRLSAKQVMGLAQSLYERGYITYMRTDSTQLSPSAIASAREQIVALFGKDYLSPAPRQFAKKVKNAQEAHEAIRPAGEHLRTPESLKTQLSPTEWKLYELIWKRTLASQMADAQGLSRTVKMVGQLSKTTQLPWKEAEFVASGRTLTFAGYLRIHSDAVEGEDGEVGGLDKPLPDLSVGQALKLLAMSARAHETQPPARYTEATLVKKLEELGIGRPSTYASILETLKAKYVQKHGQALVPSWTAFAVVQLLDKHFGELVDYAFTARMEDDLDEIASGEKQKLPYLKQFYWGKGTPKTPGRSGLFSLVRDELDAIDAAEVNSIVLGKDAQGEVVVVKPGRFGPYIKRGEETASLSEDILPDELTVDKALELLKAPKGDKALGVEPQTGKTVFLKAGRFGPYVQLGEMEDGQKPKTTSLLKHQKPEVLTIEEALQLLSLPKRLGEAEGEEIWLYTGKFGPYLKHGKKSRNLGEAYEAKLFELTFEEAQRLLKEPQKRMQGRAAEEPAQSLGKCLETGRDISLKKGRFGPYVTDGETNASLRQGDEPSHLSLERATELLQLRREWLEAQGGKKPKAKKKAAAKKTVAKPKLAAKSTSAAKPEKRSTQQPAKPAKRAAKPAAKPTPRKRKA